MEPTITPAYAYPVGDQSKTVSVGEWILSMLISAIPVVGFIMLLVWAFSSSTPPSKANWAKATLIFLLIFMVLGFLFAGTFIAMLASMSGKSTPNNY